MAAPSQGATRTGSAKRLLGGAAYQIAVLVIIWLLMAGVFVFDIRTPPDDVSICFIYAVLISISIFSFRGAAYLCAGVATILSGLGAFIQPPSEPLSLVFFANRAIAVGAQWLVAFVVTSRKDSEAKIRAEYEAERKKVETSLRFVDMLSHEIGTSLTTIGGHAFRLRKLVQGDEALTGRVEKIGEAVRHIEAVVRQVQAASEVEQAKFNFEPAAVDLKQLVTDTVLQTEGARTIHTDVGELPAAVPGDANMLQQVIANLISNALKYSSPSTPVSVWGRSEDGDAVLSVSDRGIGIPEEDRKRLFEPYYRAKNSRHVPGAGIGLYVVQRYVASHRGSIRVDSELGVGTTLTIRLPAG